MPAADRHESLPELERAMQSVLALRPSSLVCSQPNDWSAPAIRGQPRPAMRYPTGLHSHGFPEVCIALEGKAELEIAGRRHLLTPPNVAILEPGAIHCESYRRHDSSYALLWLGGARSSLLVNLSRYPGKQLDHRNASWAWQTPEASRLFARFATQNDHMQQGWFESFRSELLATLSDVYIKASKVKGIEQTDDEGEARPHERVLKHIQTLIDQHPNDPLPVPALAELTNLTPNYLNTLFRRWSGRSIHAYQIEQRMNQAWRMVETTDLLIKEIAFELGYDDPFYFSRAFTKHFGRSPTDVRSRR